MAQQSDVYGLDLNFPTTTVSATSSAATVTFTAIATGSVPTASNNGYVKTITAGAKTPVYINGAGATLAGAGTPNPILTSGSFTTVINGVSSSINYGQAAVVVLAMANLATVNGIANTPVSFNATGTVGIVAIVGNAAYLDVNGNLLGAENLVGQNGGNGVLAFPSIPDNVTPVAYFTVKNAAGSGTSVFTFGTTAWDATGITTTVYPLAVLPSRPNLVI